MRDLPLLLLAALAIHAAVLGAHALRWRFTLGPFFALLGWITATAWWASAVGGVVEWNGLVVSIGSLVFYTALALGVFVVYVYDGPSAARIAIGIVVGMSLAVPGAIALLAAHTAPSGDALDEIAHTFTLHRGFASAVASVAGFTMLAVGWELANRHPGWLPLALRVFVVLFAALVLDNLTYLAIAFAGSDRFWSVVAGGLASRTVLALMTTPLAWAYLRNQSGRGADAFARRAPLAIVQRGPRIEDQLLALLEHGDGARGPEAVLRTERALLHNVLDHMPLLVTLHGRDGRVAWCNRAFEQTLGWDARTLRDLRPDALGTIFQAPGDGGGFGAFLQRDEAGWCRFNLRHADGSESWALLRCVGIEGGLRVCLGEDLSEHDQAARALQDSHEQLRRLATHLQELAEGERAALSRVLHDDLGQLLTHLRIDLDWAAQRVPAGSRDLTARVGAMTAAVDGAMATVRRISADLRPPLFDDFGFLAAVERHVEEFQARTGTACTLQADPQFPSLDPRTALVLYRVLQESLVNVARHARASQVQVRLSARDRDAAITIADDGRGVAPTMMEKPDSFGVRGMRERVHALGGRLQITSEPGVGTAIEAIVPHAGEPRR